MKRFSVVFFIVTAVALTSCGSGQEKNSDSATAGADTIVNQNPTTVQKDSAILADDSATVETAKGVNLEEANAVNQEKAAAEKLEQDKKGNK